MPKQLNPAVTARCELVRSLMDKLGCGVDHAVSDLVAKGKFPAGTRAPSIVDAMKVRGIDHRKPAGTKRRMTPSHIAPRLEQTSREVEAVLAVLGEKSVTLTEAVSEAKRRGEVRGEVQTGNIRAAMRRRGIDPPARRGRGRPPKGFAEAVTRVYESAKARKRRVLADPNAPEPTREQVRAEVDAALQAWQAEGKEIARYDPGVSGLQQPALFS